MGTKVSVIIPTYGGSDSLNRAVMSVLDQEYDNFELIVVDDNNPESDARERTESIMRNYCSDGRVIYIKHSKNKNGAAARNTGIRKASGKYIEFLDDDDIFLSGNIKSQAEFLDKHNEYDACYCWRIENNKEICGNYEGDLSRVILNLTFTPCTPCLIFRKNALDDIGGFDESFIRHQDFQLLLDFFNKYTIGVNKCILVKIIGNNIDNQPKGAKAVKLKKYFFEKFQKKIEELDTRYPGYKKQIYSIHYSKLVIKLLRYRNISLALNTIKDVFPITGFSLFVNIFKELYTMIKRKIIVTH